MNNTISFTFVEHDETTGTREMTITKDKEEIDLHDLLYFFSDAARSAGFTYVERIGYANESGVEVWSEF